MLFADVVTPFAVWEAELFKVCETSLVVEVKLFAKSVVVTTTSFTNGIVVLIKSEAMDDASDPEISSILSNPLTLFSNLYVVANAESIRVEAFN